jgi:hypothetical protein
MLSSSSGWSRSRCGISRRFASIQAALPGNDAVDSPPDRRRGVHAEVLVDVAGGFHDGDTRGGEIDQPHEQLGGRISPFHQLGGVARAGGAATLAVVLAYGAIGTSSRGKLLARFR